MSLHPPGILCRFFCFHKYVSKEANFYSWLFLLGICLTWSVKKLLHLIPHTHCMHCNFKTKLDYTHLHMHAHMHMHADTNYLIKYFSCSFLLKLKHYITICFIYSFVSCLLIDICVCRCTLYRTIKRKGGGGGGVGGIVPSDRGIRL